MSIKKNLLRSCCIIFIHLTVVFTANAQGGLKGLWNKAKSQVINGNIHLNLNTGKKGDRDSAATAPSSQVNRKVAVPLPAPATKKVKAKSKPVCVSGDCQNGAGSQQSDDFKYDGEFKDGKFEGKGTLTYLTGNYAGVVQEGHFANGALNGFGKVTYHGGWIKSYEGNFVDGSAEGLGTRISWNDERFTGSFSHNNPWGFGVKTKNKFPVIGYWDDAADLDGTKGLTLDQVKNHLDTTFAKLVPCDCLIPADVDIPSMGLGNVNYDLVDGTGAIVGGTHHYEVIATTTGVNGFTNNTNHNIYIKAYRKFHYNTRNVDEYFDESSVVLPGGDVLGNFRSLPEGGTFLQPYFAAEIIYLGQFVDKGNAINCKNKRTAPTKGAAKSKAKH